MTGVRLSPSSPEHPPTPEPREAASGHLFPPFPLYFSTPPAPCARGPPLAARSLEGPSPARPSLSPYPIFFSCVLPRNPTIRCCSKPGHSQELGQAVGLASLFSLLATVWSMCPFMKPPLLLLCIQDITATNGSCLAHRSN